MPFIAFVDLDVVFEPEYADSIVVGIFSTSEAAEEAAKQYAGQWQESDDLRVAW
jgi:hypothetical protein